MGLLRKTATLRRLALVVTVHRARLCRSGLRLRKVSISWPMLLASAAASGPRSDEICVPGTIRSFRPLVRSQGPLLRGPCPRPQCRFRRWGFPILRSPPCRHAVLTTHHSRTWGGSALGDTFLLSSRPSMAKSHPPDCWAIRWLRSFHSIFSIFRSLGASRETACGEGIEKIALLSAYWFTGLVSFTERSFGRFDCDYWAPFSRLL